MRKIKQLETTLCVKALKQGYKKLPLFLWLLKVFYLLKSEPKLKMIL